MVLWEITLATAYFLGLRRTYRLALRIQKRVIGLKHPKIRQFVHRKIRSVFDVAVRVHKNIQQRDIEVGRNLGNRILRFLDRMKPSAEIRASPGNPSSKINNSNIIKHITKSGQQTERVNAKDIIKHITNSGQQTERVNAKVNDRDTKGKLPMRPAGMNGPYRQFSHFAPAAPAPSYRMSRYESGVFRRDIVQWMLQN